ncbi:hypothetical protein ACG2LH_09310, partial [Zhouia sp. PK063]|uniref:hypothetical protein n=1 Tax=Zhouia sp. PK063 TaxID=3373602 RepID=UPI0037A52359
QVTTIGKKWSEFEIINYQANVQPFYALLDNEGNKLNTPVGYTPDIATYANWLKEGIAKY